MVSNKEKPHSKQSSKLTFYVKLKSGVKATGELASGQLVSNSDHIGHRFEYKLGLSKLTEAVSTEAVR